MTVTTNETESIRLDDIRVPNASDFVMRAEAIFQELPPPESEHRKTGAEAAMETFVRAEKDPYLHEFGLMILMARPVSSLDARTSKPEFMQSPPERQRALKEQLCEFNHHVRSMIVASGENIGAANLEEWLGRSSGNARWARGIVGGVGGEIAFARTLIHDRSVQGIAYADVDQDLKKMDVLVHLNRLDTRIGIDIKTRETDLQSFETFRPGQPVHINGERFLRAEIGIEREFMLDNFTMNPEAIAGQMGELHDWLDTLRD